MHHSDRGSQYVSIRHTERLAEARIEPSVGSVGDSYDNALAETINGLHQAELSHRRGQYRSFEAVEFATLIWVDWFNNRGCWSPSATFRRPKPENATKLCSKHRNGRRDLNETASDKPRAVQSQPIRNPLADKETLAALLQIWIGRHAPHRVYVAKACGT